MGGQLPGRGQPGRRNHTCEQPVQDALDNDLEPKRDLVYCAARRVMTLNATLNQIRIPDLQHPDFAFLYPGGASGPYGNPAGPYGGMPSGPYGSPAGPYGGMPSGPYGNPAGPFGGMPSGPYGSPAGPYGGMPSGPYGMGGPGPYGPHTWNKGQQIDCTRFTFPGLTDAQIMAQAENAVRDGKNFLNTTWPTKVDDVMQCVRTTSGANVAFPATLSPEEQIVKDTYKQMTDDIKRFADQMEMAIQYGIHIFMFKFIRIPTGLSLIVP